MRYYLHEQALIHHVNGFYFGNNQFNKDQQIFTQDYIQGQNNCAKKK